MTGRYNVVFQGGLVPGKMVIPRAPLISSKKFQGNGIQSHPVIVPRHIRKILTVVIMSRTLSGLKALPPATINFFHTKSKSQ